MNNNFLLNIYNNILCNLDIWNQRTFTLNKHSLPERKGSFSNLGNLTLLSLLQLALQPCEVCIGRAVWETLYFKVTLVPCYHERLPVRNSCIGLRALTRKHDRSTDNSGLCPGVPSPPVGCRLVKIARLALQSMLQDLHMPLFPQVGQPCCLNNLLKYTFILLQLCTCCCISTLFKSC